MPRRIEICRAFPDHPQKLADLLVAQVLHVDAEALTVGELGVVFALPRKVGVDLDAMADIANEHEGRPAMALRKRAGVILRLAARGDHELVPRTVRAALPARLIIWLDEVKLAGQIQRLRAALLPALLRLHNEAMLLVKVDASRAFGAVDVRKLDFPLEGIVVKASVFLRGCGLFDADQAAQLVREGLEVGALVAARRGPAGNKLLNIAFGGNDEHEGLQM